ncbi:hypothetical protein ACJMK2_004852 [Sinanodonta woodiana]|uniref:RNA helicase n=1 Tax=Sinanodonta woodiana TaxID=1069815 RepID=A0ABD3VNA4_SINWO
MASGTSNKYGGVEETIQFFLGALFDIIADRVDYQHLMTALPCDILSSVQMKEIHNIKQKDGPTAATKRILEIVKASKTRGKYQALVDALKRDYQILSKALTGHPLQDDSIQKNIIKVFSSYITEGMSTIQLLPYLIRSNVIVQLEKEQVEAELRNYGNIRAAQLLLLHLPAHIENWYTEFLKALCDSGQKDLAEFIDESFTKKYTTSSNTQVLKTDTDAQLYLTRKEDMDLSGDEIAKEVRIKEYKEEDEAERKETSLENTAYVYDSADGSLDDLCAAKPRSIKPELHGAGKDIHVAISRLKVNNPTSDLQARLDQIVLQHRHKLHKRGESEILHEEDPGDVFPDDSVLDDGSLLDDDCLLAASSINETSCKHLDDSWSERQTPTVNRDSYLASDGTEEELARPALQGKNVIIMAPTGSGKTRVAFELIQDHFHQLRDKCSKVVLLVKDQALADQYGETCQELLPKYRSQAINGDIKRDKGISLGDCIEKLDILVVTAQLLLNSLMEGKIKSITQFSLLIFDECHHCHDDHAYNKIMQLYRDIKLTPEADTSSLPQIIGLTASIGVGKANGISQAKEHIKKIMAIMDAEFVSTVKDNLDELDQYVPKTSSESSSLPNWTVNEIVMVWPSIEKLLLEDLCPKLVLSSFEKRNIFSKDECDMIRRTTGRRAMTKELISIMKDRLPRSFVVLFHALNETDQQDISNELKCIIKRGPVQEAPVSNSHYFTVTAKMKQDGRTLQTVEYQINTHINQNLQILLPVTFQVVGSRMGSVIIYLRANGRNSYDAMVAFCKHGGMKNFILSLLKEKKVFKSLPAGEISIEIQVHQDKEDLNYEAKQFEAMKNVRMTESFFFCPAVDAADESCVIKENLLLQYEYVADEIDPLHFAEIFVSRGILDESFFKKLKHYRRGKRAVLFLNKVLEKGKDALYALTEDLKNKGCEDLVNKLCFAHGRSKEQWNKGNLDGNLIQVELEVTYKYFEDLMWSCRLRCEAEKDTYVMATTSQKLKVSNIPHGVTSDALQLLFENRKRSGGGKVKSLDFDTGLATAVIEFEDPSVIDRVLEKLPLAIQGQQLKMEIYKEIDESEKVVEEEDERIDLPKTTVEVSGFSQDTSKDSLEMYFENNKWSGGGPISNIDWKDKVALITFESEAVANAVLQKSHKFDGMDLKVKLYVPPPPVSMYKDKFLITGLNEKVTEDVLFNLLEARSGVSPTEILYAEDDDELKALVTFESPPEVD